MSEYIFEQYGFRAKQYDGLATIAAQRDLTPGEKGFFTVFEAMLNGDATEDEMTAAWKRWMEEP